MINRECQKDRDQRETDRWREKKREGRKEEGERICKNTHKQRREDRERKMEGRESVVCRRLVFVVAPW